MTNLKTLALVTTAALSIAASAFASEGKHDWKVTKQHNHSTHTSSFMSGFYATLGGGININRLKMSGTAASGLSNKTYKAGSSAEFIFGLGKNLNSNMRADVTMHFMPSTDLKLNSGTSKVKQEFESWGMMASGYYHFNELTASLSPYGMAGMGFSRITTGDLQITSPGALTLKNDAKETNFAWQAGVGVSGNTGGTLVWDLGYRYMHKGKANVSKLVAQGLAKDTKQKLNSHQIVASVRIPF